MLQIARRSAAAGRCGTCLEQGIYPLPATVVVHTTPEQMAWVPGAGCPTHGPAGPRDDATSQTDADTTHDTAGTADTGNAATSTADTDSSGHASHAQDRPAFVAPGPARCDRGRPLSLATLQRLACDAVIHRVILADGAVQKLETLGRLATDKQRLSLAARDGGCVFPGCTATAGICDAHHVTRWTRGGATAVDNLALLCQTHHDVIHTGQWQMQTIKGRPWFVLPAWLDPQQRAVRNTLHDATNKAVRTGQQQRLNLERDQN